MTLVTFLLITISKETASEECTCFVFLEISKLPPLLLQDIDIELKSQISSVSKRA